jgi:hypothetical protein
VQPGALVISGVPTEQGHSGGMPRMIFLLQPNIKETRNPVRRPMQLGVHSRTLAWEKCRANINVRSTEFVIASKPQAKALSTYHEIMPNQSPICNLAPRYPAAWLKYLATLELTGCQKVVC